MDFGEIDFCSLISNSFYLHPMKNIFYLLGLSLFMLSCGGDAETTNQNSDSTTTDTVAMTTPNIVIDVNALLAKFTTVATIPFQQDSNYLADLELSDSNALTANEAIYLSYGFVDNEISYSGIYPIQDFLFFDSLKTAGEYESYVEVVDIGMMVVSDAFVAQKIILDDSTSVLLWCVSYSTYEACPYSSGTILYATVFKNNVATSCTIVGEDGGGADAPVWSETLSLCSFKVGDYSVWSRDRNCGGDVDEEGNEMVDEFIKEFKLTINPQGVWEVESLTPEV